MEEKKFGIVTVGQGSRWGWKEWEVMQEEKEMRNTLRDVRRNK